MDFLTIVGIIIVLSVSLIVYLRERKYKLIYSGMNKYFYMVPLIIIIFIASTFISGKTFKPADIVVLIAILPLAFVGNKCGITEEGILLSSYLTPWDKIQSYSLSEKKNKCICYYESNGMRRQVIFSPETGKEVDNYLSKNRKMRHRRK